MLREDSNYQALNTQAQESVRRILGISKTARVIVLIEDHESSIVATAPHMVMSDSLGVLRVAQVRCETIEAMSFKERMEAAGAIAKVQEHKLHEVIREGKMN